MNRGGRRGSCAGLVRTPVIETGSPEWRSGAWPSSYIRILVGNGSSRTPCRRGTRFTAPRRDVRPYWHSPYRPFPIKRTGSPSHVVGNGRRFLLGACSGRRTGAHFAGTCARGCRAASRTRPDRLMRPAGSPDLPAERHDSEEAGSCGAIWRSADVSIAMPCGTIPLRTDAGA
jgi:hypothetical protein